MASIDYKISVRQESKTKLGNQPTVQFSLIGKYLRSPDRILYLKYNKTIKISVSGEKKYTPTVHL